MQKRNTMVRCVCNHAAYFHIHVSAWALSGAFYETGFRECAAFFLPPALLSQQVAAKERLEVAMKVMKPVLRGYIDGDVLLCEAHDWTQVKNYDYIEFRIRENVLNQQQKVTEVSFRQITSGDALCIGSDDTEEKVVDCILGILRKEWDALIRSELSCINGVVFPTKVKFLDNLQRND